jgi:hypothetical protein
MKTNCRRSNAARLKIVEEKTFPLLGFYWGAVATSLALSGSFGHDPQCLVTFVEAEYSFQWHIFVQNDYVPRGLHVSCVLFDINACYHVFDWRSSNGH